jgi:hypothetical protein
MKSSCFKRKVSRADCCFPFSSCKSDGTLSQSCSLLLPTFVYETDPFLYYSIPAVREAALSLKDVDYSEVSRSANKVTRKSRVSFENMDPILDELCGDEMDEFDDSDLCGGELGDLLTTLFFNTQCVNS